MARIDARFGAPRGVRAGITTPGGRPATDEVARGLAAGAAALDARRAEHEALTAERNAEEDRLAIASARSAAQLDWTRALDDANEAFDGGEEGFAASFEKVIGEELNARVAAAPRRRQNDLRLALMGVTQSLSLAALDIEDGKRRAFMLTRANEQADADINAVRSDPAFLDAALENRDMIAGSLPQALRGQWANERTEAIYAAYGEARIDIDPGGYLDELEAGSLDAHLAPADKSRQAGAARTALDRLEREIERRAEQAEREAGAAVSAELDAIEAAANAGLPVDEGRFDAMAATAFRADAATQTLFQEQSAILRGVAAMQDMPLADAAASIAGERARLNAKGDASGFEARRVTALEGALRGMGEKLRDDPIGFMVDRGRAEPLDIDNLDTDGLAARAALAEAGADYYGVEAQYFSDIEREGLERRFLADPKGAIETAALVAGHPRGGAMLAEIAPKAPELAHLGGLLAARGEPAFIDDAGQGAELVRTEGFKSAMGREAAETAAALVGPAFMLHPATGAAAQETARLAYEARARRKGLTPLEFDADLYERTLQEAAGGVYDRRGNLWGGVQEYRGRRVVVPRWMRNGEFSGFFRSLTDDETGLAYDESGNRIAARTLRRGTPVAVAEATYFIAMGDAASDPQWALDAGGQPLAIDFNAIRARRERAAAVAEDEDKGRKERTTR